MPFPEQADAAKQREESHKCSLLVVKSQGTGPNPRDADPKDVIKENTGVQIALYRLYLP